MRSFSHGTVATIAVWKSPSLEVGACANRKTNVGDDDFRQWVSAAGIDVLGPNVRRPGLYTQPEPARSVAMQRSRCHGWCSSRGRCTAPGGVGGNFRPHRMHCVTTDN